LICINFILNLGSFATSLPGRQAAGGKQRWLGFSYTERFNQQFLQTKIAEV